MFFSLRILSRIYDQSFYMRLGFNFIFCLIWSDGDDNEDNDSDTEFEDEANSPVSNGILSNYHSIEEMRANLEKKLGTRKFVDGYTTLKVHST